MTDYLQKFKDKFGTDLFEYPEIPKNSYEKINIICKKHGLFTTTPIIHLRKNGGCKVCQYQLQIKNQTRSSQEQLEQFVQIHRG